MNHPLAVNWTLCIAILTLLALIWQTYLTKCAFKIANKTLISTFRPKLVVRRVSLSNGTDIPTLGVPDEKPWKVDFSVANIGGTKAHITIRSFAVKMFDNKELPPMLPYALGASEPTFSLAAGEEKELSVGVEIDLIKLFRHLGTRGGYLDKQNTAFVYFMGYVHYKDDVGVVRKTFVLRHYDTETGRFKVVDDPDYEYAD